MQLLGISGSLREGSHNSALIRAAAGVLPPGWELEVYDGLATLPLYDEDLDDGTPPVPVADLREAIEAADAVLIATPEYNASIPGGLKNALDWASRPFPENSLKRKPVAVIGASTGLFGAVWAQAEVRKVLGHIGAQALDAELPVGTADEAFDENGLLLEPTQHERLQEVVAALADLVPMPAAIG